MDRTDLTVKDLTIPDYLSGRTYERYFQIEADGTVGFTGWVQRPAAVSNTARKGFGLWDNREKRIIQQPDPIIRVELLESHARHKREEAAKLDTTATRIRARHGWERATE